MYAQLRRIAFGARGVSRVPENLFCARNTSRGTSEIERLAEMTTAVGAAQYPALALLRNLDAYLSLRPAAAKGSRERGNTLAKLRAAALSDLSRAYRELRPTDPSLAACALYLIAVLLDSSLLRVAATYGSEGIMESLERHARQKTSFMQVMRDARNWTNEQRTRVRYETAFSNTQEGVTHINDPFSLQDMVLALQSLRPRDREVIAWFLAHSADGRVDEGATEVEARRRGITVESMQVFVSRAKNEFLGSLQTIFGKKVKK